MPYTELKVSPEEYSFLLKELDKFRKEKEREAFIDEQRHTISSAIAACIGEIGIQETVSIVDSLIEEIVEEIEECE